MTRLTSWWHELPGAAKFRLYTRVTLQIAVAVLVLTVVMTNGVDSPWFAPGIVIAGIAAILALHAQPDFATEAVSRRWMLPAAISLLGGVWLVYAVVTRLAASETVAHQARMAGGYTAILAIFSVVSFLPRHKWWAVAGISLATGLAYASSLTGGLVAALVSLLAGVFAVGTTLLTVWGLRVVEELERARVVETELQVAEERLRFARDLHDIVGRGFSAIAVKSELAAVLSRSGAADRAAAEMDEVKALAVESMGQMRQLVRGYRGIDLRAEVAGARSLLAAVDCRLVVEGDPARVPARYHEVAAWVVREGTTNIVEHSAATSAVLTLGDAGMSLRNNCPRGTPGERSGLRGLAERLAATGATLEVHASTEAFEIEIHWENT
ncbi:sensor histidine kinase [Nocardia goodfellowii]|uniref:Two-component system sensor histidine kinase DesK n=1 Tax=Nocardia goodfellowii TaxID=882446 RepID=A0ABS4QI02_9NOCA|nr:histidine kinase [Nocardia goodfellowii]MBP2191322.1 two-component system sensor histidine kinase DesK [Nocardia goodfellowii]